MKFRGQEIELPWERWRGVRVTPETITTPRGRIIDPAALDLLLWKAAFYDRGKGSALPDSPVDLVPTR